MKNQRLLVTLDSRRRLSLGKLATHSHYFVRVDEDGVIILTPAVVMTSAEARSLLTEA